MLWSLLTIFVIQLVAISTPGPDFLLVVRSTLKHGRKTGYLFALGISSGIVIYSSVVVFGLGYIGKDSAHILKIIGLIGGFFLLYMSYKCFTSKTHLTATDLSEGEACNKKKAWLTGFITNITNPKVMVYFLSIMPIFIQRYDSFGYHLGIVLIIVFINVSWFMGMATIIGLTPVRNFFIRYSHTLEKVFGTILILFAIILFCSFL
ncbi:LysE family translocator [Francisellaceae bacterium]|nr:LysE family translocator [Francisellaceae bacterium]